MKFAGYPCQLRNLRGYKDFAARFFNFVHFCFAETFDFAEIAFRGCLNCLFTSDTSSDGMERDVDSANS